MNIPVSENIHISLQKKLMGSLGPIDLNVNLQLPRGSLVAIYGPSGAGKTTLLRMIAGLTAPDGGRLAVGDEVWYDEEKNIFLPPQKRRVGFLFQDYALFPNMTVRGNLQYALDSQKDLELLESLLETTGLGGLQNRYPQTLSGGEQQRVALARALLRRPRILLLDEPLSALDRKTRLLLQEEILKLHHQFQTTTLLVSHDIPEVFRLARGVYLLENGRIQREGTPEEVFLRSSVSGKFRFTGEVVALQCEETIYVVTLMVGNTPVKVVVTPDEAAELQIGDQVILFTKAFNPILMKKRD